MHGKTLRALLGLAMLALAGCSSTPEPTPPSSPSPSETEQATPTPTPSPAEPDLAAGWAGSFDLLLPNSWAVRDCEGDRLDACVYDRDVMLGDVELLHGYPLDEDQIAGDGETVLADLAGSFLEHFREDRSVGCPDFEFVGEVRDATVGGQPAKRAAFSLTDDDGRVVERVVNHFTLQGDHYAIVNTDAYVTEGGCLAPSEYDPSFVPADLATLEQHLDRLVAGMSLPPTPDGG